MLLNLDIWNEIISYFDSRWDKRALRSLTIVSSSISDLALNAIWRDGENTLAIVSVINSFAPSPDKPILEYTGIYEGSDGELGNLLPLDGRTVGEWHLNREVPHAARKCALGYLARIRKICAFGDYRIGKAESLWPVLSTCLNHQGPLLPNLQRLDIMSPGPYSDPVTNIVCLISPSLRFLSVDMEFMPGSKAALTILNLAKTRGCNLQGFTYFGDSIQDLFQVVASFPKLQNVDVLETPLDMGWEPSITLIEFLTSLPSLRSLACSLDSFISCGDETPFCHTTLERVNIVPCLGGLHKSFLACTFPSVVEVIMTQYDEDLTFEGLELSFPNACKLDLRHYLTDSINEDHAQLLELKHLSSLLPLPIKAFSLTVDKQNLSLSDLHVFVKSWPNLCSFKLKSKSTRTNFDALPSLAAFSHCPNLDYLYLNIPFRLLLNDIPKVPDLMETHSAIRGGRSCIHTLYFPEVPANDLTPTPTVTTAEKRSLAKYLHMLFPNLEMFQSFDIFAKTTLAQREELAEFQQILSEVRREKEGFVDVA